MMMMIACLFVDGFDCYLRKPILMSLGMSRGEGKLRCVEGDLRLDDSSSLTQLVSAPVRRSFADTIAIDCSFRVGDIFGRIIKLLSSRTHTHIHALYS